MFRLYTTICRGSIAIANVDFSSHELIQQIRTSTRCKWLGSTVTVGQSSYEGNILEENINKGKSSEIRGL